MNPTKYETKRDLEIANGYIVSKVWAISYPYDQQQMANYALHRALNNQN